MTQWPRGETHCCRTCHIPSILNYYRVIKFIQKQIDQHIWPIVGLHREQLPASPVVGAAVLLLHAMHYVDECEWHVPYTSSSTGPIYTSEL